MNEIHKEMATNKSKTNNLPCYKIELLKLHTEQRNKAANKSSKVKHAQCVTEKTKSVD